MASLSGCSRAPEIQRNLTDYHDRLNNVLSSNHILSPTPSNTFDKSELKPFANEEKTHTRLKLHEFYGLPDCGIKPIIAERNTTLGKIQSPSQRYLYEVRLISALNYCQSEASDEQAEKLTDILGAKRKELAHAWRNVLLNSVEIQSALFTPAIHTSKEQNHDFAITRWQQLSEFAPEKLTPEQIDNLPGLEALLAELLNAQTPARIWNDIAVINYQLPQLTSWLAETTSGLDCEISGHKTKVEYLRNVFNLFFIQKIQPQTSQINGWVYQLAPALSNLYLRPNMPEIIQEHIDANTEHNFLQYKTAIKNHVFFWQKLFKRCNVSPVAPVRQE